METISIIIPTRNRATTLEITLSSIVKQRDLDNVEVFVIDNGSTDDTSKVCENFLADATFPFHYHYDAEPGLLTGRHLGASLAKGSILCFLDDDVELTPTWLEGVRDAFSDPEVKLATGPSIPTYETDPPTWLKYFWQPHNGGGESCYWLSLMDLGNEQKSIHPTYVAGLNFCIRKDALLSLGGFHPDCIPEQFQMFQGDGETGLTLKAHRLNYKCLYHPRIKLFHIISSDRLTIEYFRKRAFYQGVCNSFTDLRNQYLNANEGKLTIWHTVKQMLRPIKKAVSFYKNTKIPGEINSIKRLLDEEEKHGYSFHQKAFNENRQVRDWVLKRDYWDYKIPLLSD